MTGQKRRLFLGIAVPLDTARQIAKQLDDFDGRKIPLANWHLTLHFLGDVEEEQLEPLYETLQALPMGPPFQMVFDHLGAFPKPNKAHSLWIGAHDGSLQTTHLAQITADALAKLNFPIDPQPYLPHVTLQRFSHAQNIRRQIDNHRLQQVSMTVDHVILYESILGEGAPQCVEVFVFPFKPSHAVA